MRARSFLEPFTRVCVCVTGKIENALACARLMFLLPGDRGFAFLGRRPLQPHLPSNREFFPAQDFDFNHQFFKKKSNLSFLMTAPQKSTRGGTRKGAGRKPKSKTATTRLSEIELRGCDDALTQTKRVMLHSSSDPARIKAAAHILDRARPYGRRRHDDAAFRPGIPLDSARLDNRTLPRPRRNCPRKPDQELAEQLVGDRPHRCRQSHSQPRPWRRITGEAQRLRQRQGHRQKQAALDAADQSVRDKFRHSCAKFPHFLNSPACTAPFSSDIFCGDRGCRQQPSQCLPRLVIEYARGAFGFAQDVANRHQIAGKRYSPSQQGADQYQDRVIVHWLRSEKPADPVNATTTARFFRPLRSSTRPPTHLGGNTSGVVRSRNTLGPLHRWTSSSARGLAGGSADLFTSQGLLSQTAFFASQLGRHVPREVQMPVQRPGVQGHKRWK
jgi:hypothetical protein